MKKVAFEDLYSFTFLSDPLCSPDGRHVLFSRHLADEKTNGYKSTLWLLDTATGETKMLTAGGGERNGRWLNDREVLFAANRSGESGKAEYYAVSLDGGEGRPLFSIPERVTSLDKAGDKFVGVYVKHCEGREEKADDESLDGRDMYVFDEVYFWFNGQGIRNKLRNSLFVYDPKKDSYKQISPKYMNVGAYCVNADGTKVAFTGAEYTDKVVTRTGLFVCDMKTGRVKTLYKQGQKSVGAIAFWGDKVFASLNDGDWSGQNGRWHLFDLSGKHTQLPFVDAEVGGASGTDVNYGGGQNKKVVGHELYMTRAVWGDSRLCCMDLETGEDRTVCDHAGSINNFDIANGKAYAVALRNGDLAELYEIDLRTGEEKRLTCFNKAYRDEHEVSLPEYFRWTNEDGFELDGYVMKPVGYKPGRKYPAVLEIHGGPKTIFGSVFHHEMQLFAAHGFFVFYTNPRGSDGRGEQFAYSTKFLGTKDYEDLMAFTDTVLEKYPDIDPKKVGISGGSYGGFMCNWMVGHTDRYAAAASQRSISNYVCKLTATDIGTTYDLQQVGADPWESWETVWETSPLKYAHNAKTPTLFIQSDEDYRCWMSGAIQMFSALKMNGTDARLVLFHGENHELSRSGRPHNRVTRLQEIVGWMEKYCK